MQDVAFDRAVVEQQVEIPDPRILRFHAGQPDVAAGMLVQPPAYDDRQDQVGHAAELPGRLTELERSGVRTVWLTSGRAADRWLAEQAAVDSR